MPRWRRNRRSIWHTESFTEFREFPVCLEADNPLRQLAARLQGRGLCAGRSLKLQQARRGWPGRRTDQWHEGTQGRIWFS